MYIDFDPVMKRYSKTGKAKLYLPIAKLAIRNEMGSDRVSYAINEVIDPNSLALPEASKTAFATAASKLSLEQSHVYLKFKDRPKIDDWGIEYDREENKRQEVKWHIECLECGTETCKDVTSLREP